MAKKMDLTWLIVIASFFVAYMLSKLMIVWFGKQIKFTSAKYAQDKRFNEVLFWTSYVAFFFLTVYAGSKYTQ